MSIVQKGLLTQQICSGTAVFHALDGGVAVAVLWRCMRVDIAMIAAREL